MTTEYSIKSNNILYVNGKAILDNSKDNIERGIYTLQNIVQDFGIKIQKKIKTNGIPRTRYKKTHNYN